MNRRSCQPALPIATIAAAMLLSMSASADASLIASLMQSGQPTVSIQTSREGISDWFSRLSNAAHHMQHAFHADGTLATTIGNRQSWDCWMADKLTFVVSVEPSLPPAAPIAENLTNLPPPVQ